MKELHQMAFAYYKDANEQVHRRINELFSEMDRGANERVMYKDFTTFMEKYEDCKHLSTRRLFDELKEEGREWLSFMDVVTLFYIVYSERPFCMGKCRNLIKGNFFTCVTCFDDHSPTVVTFDVCTDCYSDDKYDHRHKNFLDNVLLLQMKRRVGAKAPESQKSNICSSCSSASSSSSSSSSWSSPSSSSFCSTTSATSETNSTPSNSTGTLALTGTTTEPIASTTSNALVPVNPRRKSSAGKNALKTLEVLLALGNIFAATQCTIM